LSNILKLVYSITGDLPENHINICTIVWYSNKRIFLRRYMMAILGTFMVPHPPLIVPEVGRGQEKEIQKTIDSYKEVAKEITAVKPETIIITSPHAVMYADYFHISPGAGASGDFGQFGAKEVKFHVDYDEELVQEITRAAAAAHIPAGIKGDRTKALDHATMVPLYFINQFYTDYKLVRIGLSGLPFRLHYILGQCIAKAVATTGRRAVFVASGDLSHVLKNDGPYGFKPEGPVYDKRIMAVMEKGDFGGLLSFDPDFCENAAQCGHRSFLIMAGALDCIAVTAKKLSYEGPFGVGYGVCTYIPKGPDYSRNFLEQFENKQKSSLADLKRSEDEYVHLARTTIETYLRTGKIPKVAKGTVFCDDDSFEGWKLSKDLLSRRAGTFVSLKEDGNLRGCIGTISATQATVAEEIIHNAISASTQDPRFPPIEKNELDRLVYSVDILGAAEMITSSDELDVKKYGVIVTKGYRRGLLLPNLETVDTVEKQIEIACKKGGISLAEKPTFERFEVVRHT
jgi:AmmeMemoRadiSam system protein A/AmmeMemoRadiSam system protein B